MIGSPHVFESDLQRVDMQEQPLLLTEDVASCIEELRRLMPMADPLQTLRCGG